jgi:hypothetical protein
MKIYAQQWIGTYSGNLFTVSRLKEEIQRDLDEAPVYNFKAVGPILEIEVTDQTYRRFDIPNIMTIPDLSTLK